MSLITIETLQLPKQDAPTRLSDLPAGTFKSLPSRQGFKKALKKGLVHIDNQKALTATYVTGGETIVIFEDTNSAKPTITIALEVLFEDDYLAVVYKPAGIVVSGNKKYTLENALPSVLQKSKQKDALTRPQPIHRLDYPTSGCLLIGKTSTVVIALNKLFEEKKVQKTYHAVSVGSISEKGSIQTPINTKKSTTYFEVLKKLPSQKYGALNLLKLNPKTGRKHQIRKHLANIQAPILGDKAYGNPNNYGKGSGLYLHATCLQFTHPITKQDVVITTPLPKKFKNLFSSNKNN